MKCTTLYASTLAQAMVRESTREKRLVLLCAEEATSAAEEATKAMRIDLASEWGGNPFPCLRAGAPHAFLRAGPL